MSAKLSAYRHAMLYASRKIILLFGSNTIATICSIVGLGFNARGLNSNEYGSLSLILAFSGLIGGICAFESWQPVVRFGVRANRSIGLILSSGIVLDVSASICAATIAIAGAGILGPIAGISESNIWLAQLHSLSLLAGVAGTPKGYFRLTDRFGVLTFHQITTAVATAIISVVLWSADANLLSYVMFYTAVSILHNLALLLRMLFTLRAENIELNNPFNKGRRRRLFNKMLLAAAGTSFLTTILAVRRHTTLLVVGSFLGEGAAGLYSIAARLSSLVSTQSSTVSQVLFKVIWESNEKMRAAEWLEYLRKISIVSVLIASVISLIGITASKMIIEVVAGSQFVVAAPIFSMLLLAECANLTTLHLHPFIQQRGGMQYLLVIAGFVTVLQLFGTIPAAKILGVKGIGVGAVLASVVGGLLLVRKTKRILAAMT